MDIRNITIIAHVDHGKTTLVDGILAETSALSGRETTERVMDSLDIERERGITIRSKNASVIYKGSRINIIDTPGHADFGGEVERVLGMADSSLLLVDAREGPMPQTRFVLEKSLRLGHKPIVVLNKIDREFSEPDQALDKIFDLFDELGADSEQLDFPVIYCSAKYRYASTVLEDAGKKDRDLTPLMDIILEHIPPILENEKEPFQFQIMNLDYDDYLGRLGIGRVFRGSLAKNSTCSLMRLDGSVETCKISNIYGFRGVERVEIEKALTGDIVAVAGIEKLNMGETICSPECEEPRPEIRIDEPTVSIYFIVNDSPMAGKDGRFVTTRKIRERLYHETLTGVAIQVTDDPESQERFKVAGRGDLHLAVLAETMRREGYEFQISRPEVIMKKDGNTMLEPFETMIIDLPEEYSGNIINALSRRRGEMQQMTSEGHGTVRLEYIIPTRGLISFRSFLLTETRGTAAMTSRFLNYAPFAGSITSRSTGALVSTENGTSVGFALFNIQERGTLFIQPGEKVYLGMVIGECRRDKDLDVNPCRGKKLTNIRASGSDEAIKLITPRKMTLDLALDFIADDELIEITPKHLRIRKKYLDPHERKRKAKKLVKTAI